MRLPCFKAFFRFLIRNFGSGIKPHAIQFAKEWEARQSLPPRQPRAQPESTSASVSALNQKAREMLRQDGWDSQAFPPVLQLAQWGLENLTVPRFIEKRREALEAMLVALIQRANSDPNGAVRRLADGLEPSSALWPEDLGPDLESAASRVLDQLHDLVSTSSEIFVGTNNCKTLIIKKSHSFAPHSN